jgi:hypothetical protein
VTSNDRDSRVDNDDQTYQDQIGGVEPENALCKEYPILARFVVFFIENQGHVEARNHEEGLHGQACTDKGQTEKAVAMGVAQQDGKCEEKSKNSHDDET